MAEREEGRRAAFAIDGPLRGVFERGLAASRPGCPFIFHHDGEKLDVRRVRRAFYKVLEARGFKTGRLAGFTLYDTKKTAAGLLINSGLQERAGMLFSGHRTSSMFDRYVLNSAERHRESLKNATST